MPTPHARPAHAVLALLVLTVGLLSGQGVMAATYYVATNGVDTPSGGTWAAPWQTIQYAANHVTQGDTVNIRVGTYRETVTVPSSGTSGARITFQAYNNEQVTISGADNLTGWINESANIWYAPMTWTLGISNQVFISDVMKPEARWPNAGPDYPWENSQLVHTDTSVVGTWSYLDSAGYDANNTNGWFKDAQLSSFKTNDYWNGATVFIMSGDGWVIRQATVTDYDATSKKITTTDGKGASSSEMFKAGNEYFLTGKKGELDSAGEWFYDSNNGGRLYVYSTPTPTAVTAKRRMYGFVLDGRSYLTLSNLNFHACSIKTVNSSNVILDRLDMKYLYHSTHPDPAAGTFGLNLQAGYVLRNSELAWDSHQLVALRGANIRVINNYFHDGAYMPVWHTSALIASGRFQSNLISHNTIHSSGRACVGGIGRGGLFQYNIVTNAMRMGTDGGALYQVNGDGENCVVRYNLFYDTQGPVGHTGAGAYGFYLDALHSGWIVHHNIIWNIGFGTVLLNARGNYLNFFNNTIYDNSGYLNTFFMPDGESGSSFFNNIFSGPNNVSGPPRVADNASQHSTWDLADLRCNRYTDPQYAGAGSDDFRLTGGSPARNAGKVIPGVTDDVLDGAPDQGALEYGGTVWTAQAGHNFASPPSPDPVYSAPPPSFSNRVRRGSFEPHDLDFDQWTTSGSSVSMVKGIDAWGGQMDTRSGSGGVKFTNGTATISQTVSNLTASTPYKLYVPTRTADATAVITIGVTNQGAGAVSRTVVAGSGVWQMNSLSFTTGSSTTAKIYVTVTSTTSTPVFVDDIGVMRAEPILLPSPWQNQDIGAVGLPSNATYTNATSTFAINGAGTNINGTADAFQFVYMPVSGNCEIKARVISLDAISGGAEAGVMIRETLNANSTMAGVDIKPVAANGLHFRYRTTTGGAISSVQTVGVTPPYWVRVVRSGNTFTGYESVDGVNWTQSGSISISMGTTVFAGLLVCSRDPANLCTATFDNVSVVSLPSPWQSQDIGAVGTGGNANYSGGTTISNGTFMISGAGTNLWGGADAFQYVYQTASDDCEIKARVAAQENTSGGAKAGVMIRETLNANSKHAMMDITPVNGVFFHYRTATGGSTAGNASGSPGAAPFWVRVVRSGSTFTGYMSVNGTSWTQVGSTTITMGTTCYIGLPVCSRVTNDLSTVTFDKVTATP